jgi:spore germination protein YaaH
MLTSPLKLAPLLIAAVCAAVGALAPAGPLSVAAAAAPPTAHATAPADQHSGPHQAQEKQWGSTGGLQPDVRPAGVGGASPAAVSSPNTVYNPRVSREVFGFAPYWQLSSASSWQLSRLSTLAYFGVTLDGAGNTVADAGWTGWQSAQLTNLVAAAHANGVRVLLTVKTFDEAAIYSIVNDPAHSQHAIDTTLNLIRSRGLDGVTIDFEGFASSSYPNMQTGFTAFTGSMTSQVHAAIPGSESVVATYASAASSDGGMFNIGQLSSRVDAFFVMAYDMGTSNTPGHASATAPLNGGTYNDTNTIAQYTAKAPASKVILGVPYYGYKFSVTSNAPNAAYGPSPNQGSDTYSSVFNDFSCAQQLSQSWDGTAQVPWAAWYSPATGDPCGGNLGSWRELYYDNAASLSAKYDLVLRTGIRGAGIWALGYDNGHSELWDVLSAKFGGWAPLSVMAGNATDSHLWISHGNGGFANLGGGLLAAPAVAVAPGTSGQPGTPYYIATGTDHHLWVRTDTQDWGPLSPNAWCDDNPAATVMAGNLYVACKGGDQALWVSSTPLPSSGLPVAGGFVSLGGRLLNGPAAAVVAGNVWYIGLGTDHRAWFNPGGTGWSATNWGCNGHPALASSGADAYFACQGTDGQLWFAHANGANWSGAVPAGGHLIDGPGIAAAGSSARIFVIGTDHHAYDLVATSTMQASAYSADSGTFVGGIAGAGLS